MHTKLTKNRLYFEFRLEIRIFLGCYEKQHGNRKSQKFSDIQTMNYCTIVLVQLQTK
jgi:hypothetical protein